MKIEIYTTSDGCEYIKDHHGIIHQVNAQPFEYDSTYVDTYRSPEYKEKSALLMGVRIGSVVALFSEMFGSHPKSLLDAGYGDGSFLNAAKEIIKNCYGVDVSSEDPPTGCIRLPDFRYSVDVVTFWDAFEHMPDLSFIKDVPAQMIFMSMPDLTGYDFEAWRHRKPNEHLHHFTPDALKSFMHEMGWVCVMSNHQEDIVRKPDVGNEYNIMSLAFIHQSKFK